MQEKKAMQVDPETIARDQEKSITSFYKTRIGKLVHRVMIPLTALGLSAQIVNAKDQVLKSGDKDLKTIIDSNRNNELADLGLVIPGQDAEISGGKIELSPEKDEEVMITVVDEVAGKFEFSFDINKLPKHGEGVVMVRFGIIDDGKLNGKGSWVVTFDKEKIELYNYNVSTRGQQLNQQISLTSVYEDNSTIKIVVNAEQQFLVYFNSGNDDFPIGISRFRELLPEGTLEVGVGSWDSNNKIEFDNFNLQQ